MARDPHGTHHQHLHVPGATPVHRLAPEAKIVATFAFVVGVALTPRTAIAAIGIDGAVIVTIAAVARLPVRLMLTRLVAIVPFTSFALFVPFIAGGEQVEIAGASLSVDGLWAAWNIVAKALLGASASLILSATTPIPDLLGGLARLKVPAVVVAIIAFMFRYLDLLVDQLQRMRTAMVARCHDARWLWQVKPIATSAGTLFVRSYEQGERVHNAMLARGFTGTMPELDVPAPGRLGWAAVVAPVTVAWAGLVAAWVL